MGGRDRQFKETSQEDWLSNLGGRLHGWDGGWLLNSIFLTSAGKRVNKNLR